MRNQNFFSANLTSIIEAYVPDESINLGKRRVALIPDEMTDDLSSEFFSQKENNLCNLLTDIGLVVLDSR